MSSNSLARSVFADALHECGGLSFLAFGLFAGDLRRHQGQYGAGTGGQMRGRGLSGDVWRMVARIENHRLEQRDEARAFG